MTDPLDWQILDDKAPEDPSWLSSPGATAPRARPSRGWWIGGVSALALVAASLALVWWPINREAQLQAAVLAAAATEPRLTPITYAIGSLGQLRVEGLSDVGDGRIQATLAYSATDVDGRELGFTVTRTLVAEGTLLAVEPIEDSRIWLTAFPRLELEVLASDRVFIERDIAPYLAEIAERACALWSCPTTAAARLSFIRTVPGAGERTLPARHGSWLLAGVGVTFSETPADLTAPAMAGRPADPESLAEYRRRLALRLLPLLARGVITPAPESNPGANEIVVGALTARTAVLLGLEPESVATIQPKPADAGLLNDTGAPRATVAERALPRLNALLGPPGSVSERALWEQLQRETDVAHAVITTARANGLAPDATLEAVFGPTLVLKLLGQLTRTDWIARTACATGLHVLDPQGETRVTWGSTSAGRLFELGALSDDGRFQPVVVGGHALLVDSATRQLWWFPGIDAELSPDATLTWQGDRALVINDRDVGGRSISVTFGIESFTQTDLTIEASQVDSENTVVTYLWRGEAFSVRLADSSETEARVFRDMQVVDARGRVVADWGEAAQARFNPRTGEIAVLGQATTADRSIEYRLTIYAGPTDPVGRIVWRSTAFGWRTAAPPAWASIQWNVETNEVIGILRPAMSDHFIPNPVLWRTDPATGESVELPSLRLAGSTIFDYSVSADGRYVALVSAGNVWPSTRVDIVSTADGTLINVFDLTGGILRWAQSGHAFTFIGAGRPEVYARPEDRAPLWATGDAGCSSPIWQPEPTSRWAPSVTR